MDINKQVKEKEVGDLEVTVDKDEKKSKGKEEIEKKEHVELVKEEVTHKERWMKRKLKKWRRSENTNKAAPPADNIGVSPTGEPAKVVRRGNKDKPYKTKYNIGDGSNYPKKKTWRVHMSYTKQSMDLKCYLA